MKLMFIDETGDAKFKDYLGICVATIDSKFYPLLKRSARQILADAGWDESTEFKGSYLFSASTGSKSVDVDARVETAHRLLDLNVSEERSRLRFAYLRLDADNASDAYIEGLRRLLMVPSVLPRPQTRAGKNLISVTCDDRDDVHSDVLHAALNPVLEDRGYIVLERVQQATSTPESIGLMFADLVAYLVGRADTIGNDAGLFDYLTAQQLANSGKLLKLQSSTALLSKISRLDVYRAE